MPDGSAEVITCNGCNKRFAWKPELAGKRVKCKCGQAIAVPGTAGIEPRVIPKVVSVKVQPSTAPVLKTGAAVVQKPVTRPTPAAKQAPVVRKPAPPKPVEDDGDLSNLYVLADDADRASAAMPVEVVDFAPPPPVAAPVKKSSRVSAAAGIPLGYAGPPGARARKREAEQAAALVDPRRDLYAPLVFLVVGIIAYMSYFIVGYHLPSGAIPFVGIGVVFLTVFKAAMLVGFALFAAGPLGVSFGSLWSAVLKLAATAVFVDGALAWVDLALEKSAHGVGGSGFFGLGMIGFPIAGGLYWGLLIYLFNMDPGDSWMVVICLSLFDRVVKFVIFMLLLNVILGWGGIAPPVTAAGINAAKSAHTSLLSTHVDELKEADNLIEARKFCAAGHQSVVLKSTNDWYAAGCPNVWFEMSNRDINGHHTEEALIVELPDNKAKRAKCFQILGGYYNDIGWKQVSPLAVKDTGDDYLELDLR